MDKAQVSSTASRLSFLAMIIPPKLKAIDEMEFRKVPAPGKWSKKQILGHLIDSASNNHQRFVRIQFENEPMIYYNQDNWNAASNYNEMDSVHLIDFWSLFNKHLGEMIGQIPEGNLDRKGTLKDGRKETLSWYITDYVSHLEHHLNQIVDY